MDYQLINDNDYQIRPEDQLAELPDLVWRTVFKFLEYDDLLSLKSVLIFLNDLVLLHIGSKTVVVNQNRASYRPLPFTSRYLLSRSLVGLRANSDMHPAIKKLVLYNPWMLFDLTGFDNLVDLTIESGQPFRSRSQLVFRLVNLERFSAVISANESNIVLETPKMSYFKFNSSLDPLRFQIIHPDSIKEAICLKIEPIVYKMVNLVSLTVYWFKIGTGGRYFFNKLKHLQQFSFFESEDDLNTTNEHLQSVLNANKSLKIFYKNIDISSNALQDAALERTSDVSLFGRHLETYQRYVDAIRDHLHHSTLKIKDFASLSVELIWKASDLESLHVLSAISDNAKWIELLKLPKLTELIIKSSVEKEQLHLIPYYCPSITSLEIASFRTGHWVLRLKCLEEFQSRLLFDFELFKKMVERLQYLRSIKASDSCEIKIENEVIECLWKGMVVLSEPRAVFLQTIQVLRNWGDLFNFELDLKPVQVSFVLFNFEMNHQLWLNSMIEFQSDLSDW